MSTGVTIATLDWGNRTPDHFIDSAIKNNKVLDSFTVIDGVKSKVQVPIFSGEINFGNDLCVFDPESTTAINEKEMSVTNWKWAYANCKTALQSSYRSLLLKKGANNAETMDDEFGAWVFDFFAKKSGEKIVELAASEIKAEMTSDADVTDVTINALTSSTILAEMQTVYSALPSDLLNQLFGGADREYRPTFYMNAKNIQNYQLAIAAAYTTVYDGTAKGEIMPYLGLDIVLFPTLADTEIIATNPANLVMVVDDYADVNAIQAEYDNKTSTDQLWGQFTIGFSYFKGENIVWGQTA